MPKNPSIEVLQAREHLTPGQAAEDGVMVCRDCGKPAAGARPLCEACYRTHIENEHWRELREQRLLAQEYAENKQRYG